MFNDMPSDSVLWLILAIILGVMEVFSLNLVTIWFAIGALFAMIAALFGVPIYYQVIIFIITTSVLLYYTKPIVKKFLSVKKVSTNADKVIGEKAIVVEKIDFKNNTGQVKVRGQIWTAKSVDDQIIEVDKMVEILEIAGVKLIVKKHTNKS